MVTTETTTFSERTRGTPPFLLLATLAFWGWQSGFVVAGAAMGVVLEAARFLKMRWDVAELDFRRIWNFCALLAFALMIFSFASNNESGGLAGLLHDSAESATHYVGVSATIFLRWLPMTFFLFVAAQVFSERGTVPLSAISWFIQRRRKTGAAEQYMDMTYPYFILCLFSSSIHANNGKQSFYLGQAVLAGWALWPRRSRRFGVVAWTGAMVMAVGLGFLTQRGVGELQRLLEGMDAQWIANLVKPRTDPSQSTTAMGRIGKLKLSGRIVIRLQTKPGSVTPTYLHEASYWHYYPQQEAWFSGETRADFSSVVQDATNDTAWTLLRGGTNSSVVSIVSYLDGRAKETADPEGLLPLPSGARHLERLPVFTLKTNKTGAVLASGPGLVMFDARFAPGAMLDTPPDASTNHEDLSVPSNEVPALEQVISEMKISKSATDKEKKLAVQQFFASIFTYSLWLGPDKVPDTNETAVSRFLLKSRSGHCEYFATATVLLLRELGIPARYAVGYAVHETSGQHGYVVRERDAHAWCLVWNAARNTWEDFDTTPASWVAAENARASAFQWLSDFWSQIRLQFSKLRWGQTNLRQYILWGLIPLLGLLLYQIIFRRGRGRRRQKGGEPAQAVIWPGLDSEFYLLERELAARGVPRQPGEALSHWLTRTLADPALADLRQPLQSLLPLHYAHRFDPRGLTQVERAALARDAQACLAALSRATPQ